MARRSSTLGPTALLRTRATTRGLLGGDPVWRTVWMVMVGGRILKRTFGRRGVVDQRAAEARGADGDPDHSERPLGPSARPPSGQAGSSIPMKVVLRNPRRELELSGAKSVNDLLARLELEP